MSLFPPLFFLLFFLLDVLTEYDEQQARLRRQLEHERHGIEQAGGVIAEDDGDDDAAA